MILTTRTKCSVAQLMGLLDTEFVQILFEKHGIYCERFNSQIEISNALFLADNRQIESLMEEIVSTSGALRNKISPKYIFEERWKDLTKCLLLDGYQIAEKTIIKTEPSIEGIVPMEDDLSKELKKSNLSQYDEIQTKVDSSANAFRKATPNLNDCLNDSRIALGTLVRKIAEHYGFIVENDSKAWGSSLHFLREHSFINKKDEYTLSSVYTFISDGSHKPLGFTEEEYTRFGRNLATSMTYYMVKLFNGKEQS